MPLVAKVVGHEEIHVPKSFEGKEKGEKVDVYSRTETFYTSEDKSTVAHIGIVDFKDVIIKADANCGPEGTESKARKILNYANDPSITAIMLDIDSPGGSVNAIPGVVDAIEQAKAIKPVLAYCGNGIAASAAYYIACAATEIYSTYNQDEIGSIGTMITIYDWEKHLKEHYSLEVRDLYATQSTEKNGAIRQALASENASDELLIQMLDKHRDDFANYVRQSRGEKLDERVLHGAMYRTKEAIKFGLIDGQKTRSEVIERAIELSSSSNTPSTMAIFGKKAEKTHALNALAAVKKEERTADMFEAAQEELAKAGIHVMIAESKEELESVEKLVSGKAETETALASAKKATKATEEALNAANEYLGEGNHAENIGAAVDAIVKAAQTAKPIEGAASNGGETPSGDEDFAKVSAGFEHNQKADNN